MPRALSPLSRCAEISGLNDNEIILGAKLGPQHRRLVARYRWRLVRGRSYVYALIVADIRAALELCALQRAADLFIVLRLFVSSAEPRIARRACPRRAKRRPWDRSKRIAIDPGLEAEPITLHHIAEIYSLAAWRRRADAAGD